MAKNPKRPGGTPPKAHQFKPGQSGNPGGRPKKAPSMRDTFLERLNRLIWVQRDGARVQAPLREALTDKTLAKAADDPVVFLKLLRWLEGETPHAVAEDDQPLDMAADAKLIAEALARLSRAGGPDHD